MSRQGNRSRNGSGGAAAPAAPTGVPVWNGSLTAIAVIVFAFLVGFFCGEELGQTPVKITPAAPVAVNSAPPDAAAGGSDSGAATDSAADTAAATGAATMPGGHDDATLKKGIAAETDPARLRMLAELFIREHRFDLGGLAAAKAVQLNPGDATSHALLGIADQGGKHDNAAARAEYQKALKLNPPAEIKDFVSQELKRLGAG